jgi:peroxiredoxin
MKELHPEFESHEVQVLAIARDIPTKLKQMAESLALPFPVIADSKGKIIKAWNIFTYGSAQDWAYFKTRMAIPATFAVDSMGKIIWRYIGARTDRPSNEILRKILATYFPLA